MDTSSTLLTVIVAIMSNGALLFVMRSQMVAETLAAAQSWLYGTVAIALGVLAFVYYPGVLPPLFSLAIPNGLIVAGLLWYSVALRQFYLLPVHTARLVGVLGVVVVSVLVFQWVWPDFQIRVLVVSAAWLVAMADSLRSLSRQWQRGRSPAASALFWLYVLVLGGTLFRLGYFLVFPEGPSFHIKDGGNWMNRVAPVLAVLLPTIGTSAFMLMCYHRQYSRARQQALTDTLTGLGNRALLMALLSSPRSSADGAVASPYRAVLLIDLDGFKRINDTYGHAVGDDVLVEVSRRLRALARKQDIVLRLGGDEFAIVLDEELPMARVLDLAQRVEASVAGRYGEQETSLSLGVSVGVAVAEAGRESSLNELIEQADRAMYDAKRRGGGYQILH